jgi:hypothetical protein
MRAFVVAMVSVFWPVALATAQASSELKVKATIEVPGQSASFMVAPFACDNGGSVFLRPYEGRSAPAGILRISADGRKALRISLSSAPGFEHSAVQAFAASPDGDVYAATTKPPSDPYLLRFDKDGQYRSSIQLDLEEPAAVMQVAVFSPKFFFVSGSKPGSKTDPMTPFAGVFNDSGKMVAVVKFPHSTKAGPRGNSSDPARTDKSVQQRLESSFGAIGQSLVESGGDGNVYFVRYGPGGPAYIVSPTGEVLKELLLDTPKDNDFQLSAVKAAGGRLAIMYEGQPPGSTTAAIKIFVYDVHSGKEVARYHHQSFEIGNALACYSPDDTFTFISSDESGKMLLVRASAR